MAHLLASAGSYRQLMGDVLLAYAAGEELLGITEMSLHFPAAGNSVEMDPYFPEVEVLTK